MNEQDKGYKDTKEFTCTGCGKKIILTKFASQKTCKCDDCKSNGVPTNPDIVAQAMLKNPPKPRKNESSSDGDGKTKIRPCIQCGKDTVVSKFMSDAKVLCDACKGTGSNKERQVKGMVQRIVPDMSKLDRSKIAPIQEYEVNEISIANPRLRKIKCPACGHEYMKPNMVSDWSQFGLVASYQCQECRLIMTISEQCRHIIKMHTSGVRYDYTGQKVEDLRTSPIEQSRYINIIRKLIKQLDDNNIKIADDEVVPFRWTNDKPVPIGFVIPDEDKLQAGIKPILDLLDDGDTDVTIPRDQANKLSNELKKILKGEHNGTEQG